MEAAPPVATERREEYTGAVYSNLEGQLQVVRRRVLRLALEKTKARQPDSDPYVITMEDKDAALIELIGNPEALKRIVGLQSAPSLPTVETAPPVATERRWDCPRDVFHHLAGQLQTVRNRGIRLTLEKAQTRQPEGDPYVVSFEDQDAALAELISDPEELKRIVGLQQEPRVPHAAAPSFSPPAPVSGLVGW